MTAMAINTTRAYLFWLAQSLWVEVKDTDYPWSSLEEGGDGVSNKFGYFPLYTVSIVFKFINTTAYHFISRKLSHSPDYLLDWKHLLTTESWVR